MHPREIVDESLRLHAQGWTDRTVADTLGISIWAVRHWRTGRRRSPEAEQKRRARNVGCCPRCSDAPLSQQAYAHLLGLYLGDGYITPPRHRVCSLSILCTNTYPRLIQECREAMAEVLPRAVYTRQREGCVEVKSNSRHWHCLFPQSGPGQKHSRTIRLERWQEEIVDAFPEELIAGLFNSDGCRINNRVRRKVRGEWKYYDYPRYFFSNTSPDIHDILIRSLDLIGIEWTLRWQKLKNEKHRDTGILSVAKRDSVALLDTFIGPKS